MQKPDVYALRGYLNDDPVAILGGARSLKRDVKNLPSGCVRIGANQHADNKGIFPEFTVMQDLPVYYKLNDPESTLIISNHYHIASYVIKHLPNKKPFTGMIAAWIACMMTSGPVILCGMDCYKDDKRFPYDKHLELWKSFFDNNSDIKNPHRIYAMSGPLINIFGKWELK